MPRKKRLRRFEPRFGVSQPMLDEESKWVKQELDNYLLLSVHELKEMLATRQTLLVTHDANLSCRLSRLPERDRLAMQCMLTRDCVHIGMLYETSIGMIPDGGIPDVPSVISNQSAGGIETLPFKTSLFDT